MIQYYDVPRSLFLEVFPVGLGSRHFIVILPKIVWKVHFAFYNQKAVKKKEQTVGIEPDTSRYQS